MKKKNLTINRLAIGNLKARKKQYIIMIIGILLAMVFSSGVLFLISCLKSSGEEIGRQQTGNAYAILYDSDGIINPEGDLEKQYISEYGYAHIIGYGYADEEKKDRGTSIAYLDEDAKNLYYITLKEGREPEKKGEIAVEEGALLQLGIEAEIGDKISLSVQTPDGDDFMEGAEEKTYTLVGVLADKRSNIGEYLIYPEDEMVAKLPAAFVCGDEKVKSGGKEINVLYYNVFEEKLELNKNWLSSLEQTDYHSEFLSPLWEKVIGKYIDNVYQSEAKTLEAQSGMGLYAMLSCVLMLVSCVGIVNSFYANLQERKKQIGMLRAVGATKRQIINIFGREAFIISLVCAPISVAISYFGVKLFAYFMGDNFIFIPNFLVLFGTAAVSVLCVLLSAFISLVAASRISPMQAIRKMELSRKMKSKNIKSQTTFEPSKLLAKRSLSLHRGKQISVSIILAATILLSCFGFSFIEDEMQAAKEALTGCDYMLEKTDENRVMTDDIINYPLLKGYVYGNEKSEIEEFSLTEKVYPHQTYSAFLNVEEYTPYMNVLTVRDGCRYGYIGIDLFIPDMQINDENFVETVFSDGESSTYKELKEKAGFENEAFKTSLTFYSAEIIELYKDEFEIIDGKINIDKLNSGEEVILVAVREAGLDISLDEDGFIHSSGVKDMDEPLQYYESEDDIRYTVKLDYKAGDTLKISTLYSDIIEYPKSDGELPEVITKYDREVKIGAIVRPVRFGDTFDERGNFTLLSTINAQPLLTAEDISYEDIGIDIKGEIDDATDTVVTQFLNTCASGMEFTVQSGYMSIKNNVEAVRSNMIALLSIIILFFFISASLINNSITAKIRGSKQEIGTLRAVGASIRDLTYFYILQIVSMFLWGSVAGFGLYGIAYLVLKIIYREGWYYPFTVWQALVAMVLLILVCSINLYSRFRKEMKNSIVENIREL